MPDKALDPVEWEIVRADIAMEKARLKANGDWAKWEDFQTQTNITLAAYAVLPLDGASGDGAASHDKGGTHRIVVGSPNPPATGADGCLLEGHGGPAGGQVR